MIVKTFTDFINIAGALGSVTVAFILPQMFYIKTYGNQMSIERKIACYLIALFGIVGSSYSIYFSIKKHIKHMRKYGYSFRDFANKPNSII
jgi:amino acid permease